MMQVIIIVNNRKIRTIDIVRVQKNPGQLKGETFDYLWYVAGYDKPRAQGEVSHNYDEGAEVLVKKVLEQICT